MGLGYIGLPTAIIAAKHGVDVVGVDINKNVVETTNKGVLHIIEPGMEQLLQDVIASAKFKAYT
jgi:UDP-N-acetyl-D-mannosaminuronic acid dehydrogenase